MGKRKLTRRQKEERAFQANLLAEKKRDLMKENKEVAKMIEKLGFTPGNLPEGMSIQVIPEKEARARAANQAQAPSGPSGGSKAPDGMPGLEGDVEDEDDYDDTSGVPVLILKKHQAFYTALSKGMGWRAQSLDANRITLAFFALGGRDVTGVLPTGDEAKRAIEWIYGHQVPPLPDGSEPHGRGGFRGGAFNGFPHDPSATPRTSGPHDTGHVAMTYTALACLTMLGDDLSRVHVPSVTAGLRACQTPEGSFTPVPHPSEDDVRFIFCACAVSYMLNDWSGVDKVKATKFLLASQSYEGGFGQRPGMESHGGSTYCAVAALKLMGELDVLDTDGGGWRRRRLVQWALERQVSQPIPAGFQGRLNKDPDSCYSFWVGASLAILGHADFISEIALRGHSYACQNSHTGGFAKYPTLPADPLHGYLALAGLAVIGEPGLAPLFPALNITARAHDFLLSNRKK